MRGDEIDKCFNPRSCTRSDICKFHHAVAFSFQSTLLYKERPIDRALSRFTECFNPRSCTRSDPDAGTFELVATGFNPRSCTRSDCRKGVDSIDHSSFNPRSCTRSDKSGNSDSERNNGFNPRSCTRSDPPLAQCQVSYPFQSTLLYKERHTKQYINPKASQFQSTLLYKERHLEY